MGTYLNYVANPQKDLDYAMDFPNHQLLCKMCSPKTILLNQTNKFSLFIYPKHVFTMCGWRWSNTTSWHHLESLRNGNTLINN
jgi:hypothetical protein